MEEKKEIKVAKNVSSGAEKVERIERTTAVKSGQKQDAQTSTAQRKVKQTKKEVVTAPKAEKPTKNQAEKRAEKENERARARVDKALKKKEAKAKREEDRAKKRAMRAKAKEKRAKMTAAERKAEAAKIKAERKAEAEKRQAERKAKAAKKRAERKERMAKRAAERKEKQEKHKAMMEARQRERAHKKANRRQEKSKAKQKRNTHKRERRESRGENRGYGGWLAAVIALGAVTLGLTTAVTVGAIEMNGMQNEAMTGMQSTTYELMGIMEHVDDDLDRARISNSTTQQERIFTDLLVQARLAELDLEKLPIDGEMDRNVTQFINRVGSMSERMLAKLRHGESLSKADVEELERLYQTNHQMRMQLDEYAANMTDKDMLSFMKKGEGSFGEMMKGLENLTLEENRAALERMREMPMMPPPSKGEDNGSPKIDPAQAEDLCSRYFSDYSIGEFQCIGETVTRGYAAYNVQGYDDKGTMLFAEIDYVSGDLIRFDYFEMCDEEKFDTENALMIAQNFLEKLGYDDMTAVRTRENGTNVDFQFVYEEDGVVYYPDTVRVKVCRSRGVVTGFDSANYLQNHENREDVEPKLTLAQAQAKLHTGLNVDLSRLAVVKAIRGERAAYEFLCSYGEEKYLVYIDAMTGDEIAIVNIKNL